MTEHPRTDPTATLLVCCPDRKGLVAALAQLLYGHGANILDADQHTDAMAGMFFQRIRFDLSEMHTDRRALEHAIGEVAERFSMDWSLRYAASRKRMAIFVSRYDHCLYDLLLRHRAGELVCDIPLIVSNHEDLRPIADHFGIDFQVFPIDAETKREQEAREMALLKEREIDVIVLARYMQILTSAFVAAYPARIINIHHSFLPAFVGGKPYPRPTAAASSSSAPRPTTSPAPWTKGPSSSRTSSGLLTGTTSKTWSARGGTWSGRCCHGRSAGISRTGCWSTATRPWCFTRQGAVPGARPRAGPCLLRA